MILEKKLMKSKTFWCGFLSSTILSLSFIFIPQSESYSVRVAGGLLFGLLGVAITIALTHLRNLQNRNVHLLRDLEHLGRRLRSYENFFWPSGTQGPSLISTLRGQFDTQQETIKTAETALDDLRSSFEDLGKRVTVHESDIGSSLKEHEDVEKKVAMLLGYVWPHGSDEPSRLMEQLQPIREELRQVREELRQVASRTPAPSPYWPALSETDVQERNDLNVLKEMQTLRERMTEVEQYLEAIQIAALIEDVVDKSTTDADHNKVR